MIFISFFVFSFFFFFVSHIYLDFNRCRYYIFSVTFSRFVSRREKTEHMFSLTSITMINDYLWCPIFIQLGDDTLKTTIPEQELFRPRRQLPRKHEYSVTSQRRVNSSMKQLINLRHRSKIYKYWRKEIN